MKNYKILLTLLSAGILALPTQAERLQQSELEHGALLPGYSNLISSPFDGVAAYANGDGVEADVQIHNVPGQFRLDLRGASTNNNPAGIAVYLDDQRLGNLTFDSTTPSVQNLTFELENYPASPNLKLVLETDNGSNDTYLDWFELHRIGDIPPPPPPPVLPGEGAYDSGIYRNLFVELGYSQAEVDARVQAVYEQLFHSSDLNNEALFIPVGTDMAYIWDVGNNDVRSEGMSYGMMMAVQMGRKDDFDRLWKWAHTYSLNKSGDMKGYFAWQVSTEGQVRDANPAPDGEVYFATALFFASHLWGDGEGIYNYSAQANAILDNMYNNGQTRYNNQGELEYFSLFDHDSHLIVFSPATPSDRNWTDPSYHLPAYFELWAMWADHNNQFWADAAEASRQFLKTTVNPDNGLSPDYAYFNGEPHGAFQHWKDTFQYDAWRTVSNAAIDYAWFQKDPWQNTYAETLQQFFASEGIDSYASLYELNGEPYQGNTDHSPGLVAMNAVASLASDDPRAWDFVQAFWDTPVPTGQWRYYDGSLYMLAMLRLSGNYRIICPAGECDLAPPPSCEQQGNCSTDKAPVATPDTIDLVSGETAVIDVLQNDFHPDGIGFSLTSYSQGGNGTVTQNGALLSYTPAPHFTGADHFTYTISDGTHNASAQVTVNVQSAGNNNGDDNDGNSQLIGKFEFENASGYFPSYRGPMQYPYPGATIHDNGEGVTFNMDTLVPENYTMIVNGSSSNNTTASVSVYINNTKVGAVSFSGSDREEQSISFTLTEPSDTIVFTVETNTGQNDTQLDWFQLYSGAPESGTGDTRDVIILQAEDYTDYYDTTPGNTGGSYRQDDADIQITSDENGGYNLGWTDSGEWLEYTADFAQGQYRLATRVATNTNGPAYNIQINGNTVVPTTIINNTGGWQNWQTQEHASILIPAGRHTIRLNIVNSYLNLNWIKFIPE